MYEFKNLVQTQDEGQPCDRAIKNGTLIVEDYGVQFIDGSKPSNKVLIEDYDGLHAIF